MLLKNDTWIHEKLPHLLPLIPRQRYKVTHLEAFYYPIWAGKSDDLSFKNRLAHPQKVLFDYATTPIKMLLIDEE